MTSTQTGGTGTRGRVVGAAVVATAALATWSFVGNDVEPRNDDEHVITVAVWSSAGKTHLTGRATSNVRGVVWSDNLTTGRLAEPFRQNIKVSDGESVSVTVQATISHQPLDAQVSCNITVDGDVPTVRGGFGRPSAEKDVPVGGEDTVKCHLNWVGKSLR